MSKKEHAFEYIVPQIAKWWIEENPKKDFTENDLSPLKVMRILFLISAVNANPHAGDGLLDIFNRWVAMPYGHIEVDVMQMIRGKKGLFKNFTISERALILN